MPRRVRKSVEEQTLDINQKIQELQEKKKQLQAEKEQQEIQQLLKVARATALLPPNLRGVSQILCKLQTRVVERGKIKYGGSGFVQCRYSCNITAGTWEIKGDVLRTAAVLVESISRTVLAKNVELRRFERAAQ